MRRSFCAALALCLALNASAQDASERQRRAGGELKAFVGSWQLDPSRTKAGSTTLSYEQAGDSIRATTPAGAYKFKVDGNEYPTARAGEMITWKQVNQNTIETTSKRNGKIEAVATRVFSPDGKTASVTIKVIRGTPTTVTGKMERQTDAAGAHPLIGIWKQRFEPPSDQAGRLTYTPVANGLHVRYEGMMPQEYDLLFDGKQRPVEAAGGDLIARRIDDHTIEEQWTRDGKLFTTSTITVSPDGQELTERSQRPDAHSEPSMTVYRRTK